MRYYVHRPMQASSKPVSASLSASGSIRVNRKRRLLYSGMTWPKTRPGMSICKASFELIESTFCLALATAPSLFHPMGVFSKHNTCEPQEGRICRLSVFVKVHQRNGVANYFLSLNHDFSSGLTNAFLCREVLVEDRKRDKM
jgi:hypothetical protein